jgi:aspartyl protease family protein
MNGKPMNFIFDTGASNISIFSTVVIFLYKHGPIIEEEMLGSFFFQDATGSISGGSQIVLKSIKIGTKEINKVKASVIHDLDALFFLGQSALAEFGKVPINYNKNIISFE